MTTIALSGAIAWANVGLIYLLSRMQPERSALIGRRPLAF